MKCCFAILAAFICALLLLSSASHAAVPIPNRFSDISDELNKNVGSKLCKLAYGAIGTFGRALAVIGLIVFGACLLFAPFGNIRMASLNFAAILIAAIAITTSAGAIVDMLSNQVILRANSTISNCAGALYAYYKSHGNRSEYRQGLESFGNLLESGIAVPGAAVWEQVNKVVDK